MQNENTGTRNENIDFLRAIAILLVMLVHFPRLRQILPFLNPWSGVDLFFAISGFVVAKSFVPHLESAQAAATSQRDRALTTARHVKAFFVRRFFRIMPALVFALAFYLILGFILEENNLKSSQSLGVEIFSIFTYTANFFAAYTPSTTLTWHWSLAAEEQFYFLFPFFILLFKSHGRLAMATLLVLIITTFLIRPFGEHWFGNPPAAMYLPQFRNDGLAYGFLIFLACEQPWFKCLKPKYLMTSYFGRISAVFALITVIALAPELAFNYNFAIPTIGIASAFLIALALWSDRLFIQFRPIASVFRWIGLRSYGLYLLHVPVVRLVQEVEARHLVKYANVSYPMHFLIVLTSLCLIVEFCFRIVEMPTQRFGRSLSQAILQDR